MREGENRRNRDRIGTTVKTMKTRGGRNEEYGTFKTSFLLKGRPRGQWRKGVYEEDGDEEEKEKGEKEEDEEEGEKYQ